MKHTTRKQDAALLLNLFAEATKARKAGERVLAKGGGETTISAIDGDVATLANGERAHISKLRSAPNSKREEIKLSEVEISTHEYESAHGHAPKGRGHWGFFFGNGLSTPWFAPGDILYSEARKLARVEAQRRGVTRVSVAS